MLIIHEYFNDPIPSTYDESFMIIIDCLSIGLIFQYCAVSEISIQVPFILITLISSGCNGLGYLLNLSMLNYQRQLNKKKYNECSVREKLSEYSVVFPIPQSP